MRPQQQQSVIERHRAAAARASQRAPSDPQRRGAAPQRDISAPRAAKPETPRPAVSGIDDDPVDQASYDSFPASDPPAHSSNRAMPGGKRER